MLDEQGAKGMMCKGVDLEEARSLGEREIPWCAMLRTLGCRQCGESLNGFRQGSDRTKYGGCRTALEALRVIVDVGAR